MRGVKWRSAPCFNSGQTQKWPDCTHAAAVRQAAGRLLICRDRGQLNFPCDSCCSHCRQSSLQCPHLPPLARCTNHSRVAINRYRFPKTRSHYSHNLITKYLILTAWRNNTSTCSYCRHSVESRTCFSLKWRLQSSAVIERPATVKVCDACI